MSIILSSRYAQAQANRSTVNTFDANNTRLGTLAELAADWKASYSEIVITPKKGVVLFNLYPNGDRTKKQTIIINGKLKASHLAQAFTVPELVANPVFESFYRDADGKEQAVLTLQKPSSGIPEQPMMNFDQASLQEIIAAATKLALA